VIENVKISSAMAGWRSWREIRCGVKHVRKQREFALCKLIEEMMISII
jgi:hypothetical protein